MVPSFTRPDERPDHYKMFNARGETLREKRAFGRLLRGRRCVALVDGFYEWKKEGPDGTKQPYYLYVATTDDEKTSPARTTSTTGEDAAKTKKNENVSIDDDAHRSPLLCAALYDVWRSSDPESLESDEKKNPPLEMTTVTLVTVPASDRIAWLHDRMPALLRSEEEIEAWLFPGDDDRSGDEPSAGSSGKESERDYERLLRPYDSEDLKWHPVTTDVNVAGRLEGPECCAVSKRAVERDAGNLRGLFEKIARDGESVAPPAAETLSGMSREERRKLGAVSPARWSSGKRSRTTTNSDADQKSVADFFARGS